MNHVTSEWVMPRMKFLYGRTVGDHSVVVTPCNTCNTLQHSATLCNTLQHSATPRETPNNTPLMHSTLLTPPHTLCNTRNTLQHSATKWWCMSRCKDTPQHTATHCNTLQHHATHCNTLQRSLDKSNVDASLLQLTFHVVLVSDATHCNTRYHTATHCNTLQHPATPWNAILTDLMRMLCYYNVHF